MKKTTGRSAVLLVVTGLLGCNTSLSSLPPDAAISDASTPSDSGNSCTPESNAAFCASLSANCGSFTALDNCHARRTANCGSCTAPETCGGGGTANVCGCTRESDPVFCARNGVSCGSATGTDNCGASRTVANCGTCTTPQTCGGGGVPNVCGPNCMAETDQAFCTSLGAVCGSISGVDNCGKARTVTNCGSCVAPQTCGGSGVANACGCPGGCGVDGGTSGDAGLGDGGSGDGGSGDAGSGDGGAMNLPCTISITPATTLYFGGVHPNAPVTKSVVVSDTGDMACQVSDVAIAPGSDPGFVLAPPGTTSFTVSPGQPVTIGITFSSATVMPPLVRTGTLTLATTDTTKPTAVLQLNAYLVNTSYSPGWPKWHFDNRNSGQSEADTSLLTGTVAWKFLVGVPSGTTYINSPVVDGSGNVYQLGMDGTFHCVNSSGTQVWSVAVSVPTGDPHPSTPNILANGDLYLVSGSDDATTGAANIYIISPTGSILYSEPFGEDGFDAVPIVGSDGTLFEADDDAAGGSDPYSVIAFQNSGNALTQIAGLSLPLTNESERFGIAVADDDTCYLGNNGQYFAITPPLSGFKQSTAWPAAGVTISTAGTLGDVVVSDLAIDGRVNENLYAYSAWEGFDVTGATTVQGVLVALNPANGATVWTLQLPMISLGVIASIGSEAGNASPAVADDGTVYVGNGDGLRSVNGATGAVNWLFTSACVTSSPAIGGDGTIFFGTLGGTLYAVNSDGSLRFKITTGGPVSSSPAIASDGTVYIVSDDGNIYAIK
jgi:outer membrane protein assembly factor BamB